MSDLKTTKYFNFFFINFFNSWRSYGTKKNWTEFCKKSNLVVIFVTLLFTIKNPLKVLNIKSRYIIRIQNVVSLTFNYTSSTKFENNLPATTARIPKQNNLSIFQVHRNHWKISKTIRSVFLCRAIIE